MEHDKIMDGMSGVTSEQDSLVRAKTEQGGYIHTSLVIVHTQGISISIEFPWSTKWPT